MTAEVSKLEIVVDSSSVKLAIADLRTLGAASVAIVSDLDGAAKATSMVGKAAANAAKEFKDAKDTEINASKAASDAIQKSSSDNVSALQSLSDAWKTLKSVYVANEIYEVGKAFIHTADEANILHNRLAVIIRDSGELSAAESKLYNAANQTRTSYADTVDMYSKVARATESFGASQERNIKFVTAVNEAIQLSGVGTAQAKAGMYQLTEMMSSGIVGGIHLKAMMQDIPEVARIIAAGMDVPVGRLREMAREGKLTADDIFNAMIKGADELDSKFQSMPATVESSMTKVKNSIMNAVSEADKHLGATKFLSKMFSGAANALDIATATFAGQGSPSKVNGIRAEIEELKAAKKTVEEYKSGGGNIFMRLQYGGESGADNRAKYIADINKQIADKEAKIASFQPKLSFRASENLVDQQLAHIIENAQHWVSEESHKHRTGQQKFDDWLKVYEMKLKDGATPLSTEMLEKIKSDFIKKKHVNVGVDDNTGSTALETALSKQKAAIDQERTLEEERNKIIKFLLDKGTIDRKWYDSAIQESDKEYLENIKANFEEEKRLIKERMDFLAGGPGKSGKDIKDTKKRNEYNNLSKKFEDVNNAEEKALQTGYYREQALLRASEIADLNITKELHKQILAEEAHKTNAAGAYAAQIEKINDLLEKSNNSNMTKEEKARNESILTAAKIRASEKFRTDYAKEQAEAWKIYRDEIHNSSIATDALKDVAIQAADELQKNLGTYTKNLLEGNFKDIGKSFEKLVDDMLQKAITANLGKVLFGSSLDGIDKKGGLGDGWIGQVFGSVFGPSSAVDNSASGAAILGRHADGGSTSPNSLYEVAERGPELFSSGGHQYLLTGNKNGQVTRNSQSGLGGGNNNVNVTINGNAKVKSDTTTTGPDGSQIRDLVIDVITHDIGKGGQVADALQGVYGLNRWNGAR